MTFAFFLSMGLAVVSSLASATTAQSRPQVAEAWSLPQAPKESLGLSAAQRQSLYVATAGSVDLRNVAALMGVEPDARGSHAALGRVVGPLAVLDETGAVVGDARHYPEDAAVDGASARRRGAQVDPLLVGQWWVDDLHVEGAWQIATGKGVTIADCDAGFYIDESDLQPNLVASERHDFSDSANPMRVDDGRLVFHGTAVAAIMIGARDGFGTNGLAFDARLIPLQNFNYDRALDRLDKEEATARCILGALKIPDVTLIVVENQTAQGSSETYSGTRAAVRLAVLSGVPVVSAAGNASVELKAERADDTGSIIVGAIRQSGRAANFSNFGERVTVAGFGENIQTLYGPAGRTDTFGGTTGATAQVGGAVALMLAANPRLSPLQVRQILEQTRVTDASNERVGGRLDIEAAVRCASETDPDRMVYDQSQALRRHVIEILEGRY